MKRILARSASKNKNRFSACSSCDFPPAGEPLPNIFTGLTDEEQDFVLNFLKYSGNFKALQRELNVSYPTAKKRLGEILSKLGLKEKPDIEEVLDLPKLAFLPIEAGDSSVTKAIKESLNAANGKATISLFKGDPCDIWFDDNGRGLVSPKIPLRNQLTWEVFDAAVEVVRKNGGRAKKGNAQSGAKLGSEKLSLDSVEGYVAHKVHGVKEGDSAFGPAFVICAILDWAGVCHNTRGYLTINPSFSVE